MVLLKFLLILVLAYSTCESAQIPSYFKFCKRNDPEISQCIFDVAQSVLRQFSGGIPELGVEPLDPLNIDNVNISSLGNIGIVLRNTTIYGLKDSKVTKMKVDLVKQKIVSKYAMKIDMKGQYKMDGQILILPIKGEGDYVINIPQINCTYKYDFELFKKEDDLMYPRIINDELKCKIGKAHFDLKNLFGGDKTLGKTMNQFMNDNSEEIMKGLSGPAMEAIKEGTKRIVNQFYGSVPYDVMLPL